MELFSNRQFVLCPPLSQHVVVIIFFGGDRERDRKRERERDAKRKRGRKTEREREREKERETEKEREKERVYFSSGSLHIRFKKCLGWTQYLR